MVDINCISVKQPWAWAIFHAGKDVENRSWRSSHRGKLMIHTSKNFDENGYKHLQSHKEIYGIDNLPTIEELKNETGGLYGMVDMVSCRWNLPNNIWKMEGLYGWIVKNPVRLNFVPYKGRLSFFNIELNCFMKEKLGLTEPQNQSYLSAYKNVEL